MACYHIKYVGGTNPFGSGDDNYYCDLCPGKTFDWGDATVEHVCNNGEAYRNCPIWKRYA